MKNNYSFLLRFVVKSMLITLPFPLFGVDYPIVKMPSPEDVALTKRVVTNVDMYTGRANVQLPVANIGNSEINIPISLRYTTGGIKAGQPASWVGLGWDISTGGRITRIVRSRPDELGFWEKNYVEEPKARDFKYSSGYDGECDLFFYEIPGESGIFVVNNVGDGYTIPKSNTKIKWNLTRNIWQNSSFTITDSKGYNYKFLNAEDRKVDQVTHVSSWQLVEISKFNNTIVKCTIQQAKRCTIPIAKTGVMSYKNEAFEEFLNGGISADTVTMSFIKEVIIGNEKLVFNIDTNRPDLPGSVRLTAIEHKIDNKTVRATYFNYEDFKYVNGLSKGPFPQKLTSVYDVSKSDSVLICMFDYYMDNDLSPLASTQSDFWGYHNNCDVNILPQNMPYYRRTIADIFREPTPKNNDNIKFKIPDFIKTRNGSLRYIWYPKGGVKEFVYEQHMTNEPYPLDIIGGLRVKSIIESDGISDSPSVTNYSYSETIGTTIKSSAKLYDYGNQNYPVSIIPIAYPYPMPYNWNKENRYVVPSISAHVTFDFNGCYVGYSEVKEILPNGSYNIYKFTSFDDDLCSDENGVWNEYGKNTNMKKDLSSRVPKTTYFYRRGLLKEQTNYSASDILISKVNYFYNLNPEPKNTFRSNVYFTNGKATIIDNDKMVDLAPDYWLYGVYNNISQPIYLDSIIVAKGKYNFASSTHYEYGPNHLLPIKIVQKDAEGNSYVTKTKYSRDFPSRGGYDGQLDVFRVMSDNNMILPIEVIKYKNDKILGAELHKYKLDGPLTRAVVIDEINSFTTERPIDKSEFKEVQLVDDKLIIDNKYDLYSAMTYYNEKAYPISVRNQTSKIAYIYDANKRIIATINDALNSPQNQIISPLSRSIRFDLYDNQTVGEGFHIPVHQTVKFKVVASLPEKSGQIPPNCLVRFDIKKQEGPIVYTKLNDDSSQPLLFDTFLEVDSYELLCAIMPTTDYDVSLFAPYRLDIVLSYSGDGGKELGRENQVFYTSFEDDPDAISLTYAKTGIKAHKGNYDIDLSNFDYGQFRLSYWTSNNGIEWSRVTDIIGRGEDCSDSYQILTREYIDELSIIPIDATISTRTYGLYGNVTSETDTNGKTVYYEYNDYGQLVAIRNNDRHIVEKYDYKF